MSNEVSTAKKKVPFSAFMTADVVSTKVNSIIGDKKEGAKFVSNIVSAVQANPMLQECTNQSILNCALVTHSLNLSPSPQLGQVYMIPFNNKKAGTTEAQLQIGYKAYIQMAIRSGYYTKLNVVELKDGELIKYDPLNEEIDVNLIENDIERENAKTTGYYAMFEYSNGFKKTLYWSKEKMMTHADKYSQSFSLKTYEQIQQGKIKESDMWKYSSPWYSKFDDMAKKTLLKQLLSKWGILSIELQEAIIKDQSVIKEDGTPIYVDNNNDDYIIDMQEEKKEAKKEKDVSHETVVVQSLDDID